jgi:hypothetical protein
MRTKLAVHSLLVLLTVALVVGLCACSGVIDPKNGVTRGEVEVALSRLSDATETGAEAAEEVWNTYSPELQEAVKEALTPARIDTVVTVETAPQQGLSPMAVCTSFTVTVTVYSTYGNPLFAWVGNVGYCYNGSNLTSVGKPLRYGMVYAPFWVCDGEVVYTQSGGQSTPRFRFWSQGRFRLATAWVTVQERRPWVDLTVMGNGSRYYKWGW